MLNKLILFFFFAGILFSPVSMMAKEALPPALTNLEIQEHLGKKLPLDFSFTDEFGKKVQLSSYFDGKKPVILSFVYFRCPMLCNAILEGLAVGLKRVPLAISDRYQVVSISFDSRDNVQDAGAFKKKYMKRFKNREKAAKGWHFLVGDPDKVKQLADAVGFRYYYDEKIDQFAHPAAVFVLSGKGTISHYLYGIKYNPVDIRLSLLKASKGHMMSTLERSLLYCYHYDPASHRYTLNSLILMRVAGGITLLALGLFFFIMFRKNRRKS